MTFKDDTKASLVMKDWYDELVANDETAHQADDMPFINSITP